MLADLLSHPDRLATTLATLADARASRPDLSGSPIGPGATDCRLELKLAQWKALRAASRSPAAAAHLAIYGQDAYPELWAGTVRDGVARGFMVHLEETCSLAGLPLDSSDQGQKNTPDSKLTVFTGKDLRRKKDILIASAGCRVRFSRKGGLLFVDREQGINSENCLWFEGRRDSGTLDNFVGHDDERARLFSAQYLKPQRFVQGKHYSELELNGRLGRGTIGWPCRIIIVGSSESPSLHVTIELASIVPLWRLRSRWLGVPETLIHHHCMPVRELVTTAHGGFVADTLSRSCATLLVDGEPVPTPDAAKQSAIKHTFSLGKTSP